MSPQSARWMDLLEHWVVHFGHAGIGADWVTKRRLDVEDLAIASAFVDASRIGELDRIIEPGSRFLRDGNADVRMAAEEHPNDWCCRHFGAL